jgi:hypothetical protein
LIETTFLGGVVDNEALIRLSKQVTRISKGQCRVFKKPFKVPNGDRLLDNAKEDFEGYGSG